MTKTPGKAPGKYATIQDVAARAGVSPSTVSYVLSGKRSISESTRQKVLQTIEEMNYTASSLGQRMRQGKTQSIGVASPALRANDWSLPEFFGSIAAAAGVHDYTAGFFVDRTPHQLVELGKSRFVDGFLLIDTTAEDPRVEALKENHIPFVVIGRVQDNTGISYVDFEFEQVMQSAFRHLFDLGHRKIAYHRLPPRTMQDINNGFYIEDSYRRAREDFNIEVVEQVVPMYRDEAFTATLDLLDRHPDVTAIIAHNHIETLHALHERHVRVPEEVSVIGITTAVAAEGCIPPLTSVDVPISIMTKLAVDQLIRIIGGEAPMDNVLMPAKLIPRKSTSAPLESKLGWTEVHRI